MPPKQTYLCNCERYCRGEKAVRKMIYYAHVQYLDPHSEFSAEFWEYLRTNPVVFRPLQNPCKHVNRNSDVIIGGPQRVRVNACTSHQMIAVRAMKLVIILWEYMMVLITLP